MNYKTGLRIIREMNLVGGVMGYGSDNTIGQHGGAVGNDPDAWKNSYTNIPIDYLHGDGKTKKKSKKKSNKKKKSKIPLYKRSFVEALNLESVDQDPVIDCLLYTKNPQYQQVMADVLHDSHVCFIQDEEGIVLEGTDSEIQTLLESIEGILTSEVFENGEVLALIGEMDTSSMRGLSYGKTLDDFYKKHALRMPKSHYAVYLNKKINAGMQVEKEHSSDPKITLSIAMDHIWEDIDYYEKLAKMEQE